MYANYNFSPYGAGAPSKTEDDFEELEKLGHWVYKLLLTP
jgi:hypothetical protein